MIIVIATISPDTCNGMVCYMGERISTLSTTAGYIMCDLVDDFTEPLIWEEEDIIPKPINHLFPIPRTLTNQINNVPQITRKSMFSRSGYLPVRVRERRKR